MSDDSIKIEVDGQTLDAKPGQMLIDVTDAAGIYIPRFCYHKHLSVAANCRMCLVEVERAPKPMPACATPVMDGMKVSTRSEKAVAAQHATMEFLLINHPLDCPICDQGGECELQDLAMGYGGDVSRFTERKRVVRDKDIGPLVQTDMTRCIHCTRCVRFGEEIAGLRELGATGRGEHMEIGTYIEKAMTSELSGNVIDLCPVGALTNKPYRYSARAWELQQYDGVAPHDGLNSALSFHARGSTVKRVIPKEHAAVNEVWLSDRDRYSYQGMHHGERLQHPRIKRDGRWHDCDWDQALSAVVDKLREATADQASNLAALASPSSTTEEFYLLQRLLRELGSHNIDHRLRQLDFSDQQSEPLYPSAPALKTLEQADAVLLIGAYPRHELPLLNLRLRKAALQGAAIMTLDSHQQPYNFNTSHRKLLKPSELANAVATIAAGIASAKNAEIPVPLDKLVSEYAGDDELLQQIASCLAQASRPVILCGQAVEQHPLRSQLLQLSDLVAQVCNAQFGLLAGGANAAGAWLAGAVPHRGPVGRKLNEPGESLGQMLAEPKQAYMLLGFDPELDSANSGQLVKALDRAGSVIACTGYVSASLEQVADIMLPIAVFGENEGSFVNLNGLWSRFESAVRPLADARPAWKILRMLGHKLELPGFDAVKCGDVTAEIYALARDVKAAPRSLPSLDSNANRIDPEQLEVLVDVPMYATDQLVRHADALQQMPQAGDDRLRLSATTASKLGLSDGDSISLTVAGNSVVAELLVDDNVADGVCAVSAARQHLCTVAVNGAAATLSKASGNAAA